MCSGARSSSANGAIAARAAPACSWSTSSSTVLSDCTIRGPSVILSIIPTPTYIARACVTALPRNYPGLVGRHHRRDAVDRELADPAGRRVVGGQLPAADVDRRHHPLGGHPGRVDVADHHRALQPRRLLQLRHGHRRVDPHAGERRGRHLAQHRDDRAQRLARRGRRLSRCRGGRRGRAPAHRGRGCRRSLPVESSAAGAKPAVRNAASTSEIGACDTATVGASSRISSGSVGGRADRLRQQRGILTADERRGHPDPQLSVPAGDVVDEIRQALAAQVFWSAARKAHAARLRCDRCPAHAGSTAR